MQRTRSISLKTVVAFFAVCACLLSFSSTSMAAPAGYPNKNINVIICFPGGGGSDIILRGFFKVAEKYTNVKFLPTNINGANGWAGWHQFLSTPSDGYTLTMATVNLFLDSGSDKSYKDITPVVILSRYPTVIAVAASSDIKTMDDLIKRAKAKPNDVRFGVDGINGSDHQNIQKFEKLAGLSFKFVPYRGGGETIAALLGGNVDAITCNLPEINLRDDIRILAVLDEQRHPKKADIPTMKDLGYDIVMTRFRGVGIQSDAPVEVIAYLESIFAKTTADPEWVKWADSVQAEPYYLNRADSLKYYDEMRKVFTSALEKK